MTSGVPAESRPMWSHCLVCSSDLGRNEELEFFQVGNRLAYDPERGRLWVICPKCSRWGLTPLEIRWEVLEALEILWEKTPAKVQGENIALGRTASGLRIIRVGRTSAEKELAIWRWGSRVRPWHQNLPLVGTVGAVGGLAAGLAIAPQAALLSAAALGYVGFLTMVAGLAGGIPVPVGQAGDISTVSRRRIRNAGMNPTDDELGWAIYLERAVYEPVAGRYLGHMEKPGTRRMEWVEFNGTDAVSIARRAFPLLNRRYSDERLIGRALTLVSEAGGAEGYLRKAAAEKPRWVKFQHYPDELRLSLEMVLFQEQEQRVLEGELAELTGAWEEAERIAAISDGLIPPRGWYQFRDRVRRGDMGPPPALPPRHPDDPS